MGRSHHKQKPDDPLGPGFFTQENAMSIPPFTKIAVTINSTCQLQCPHCYLGESDSSTRRQLPGFGTDIDTETIHTLFQEIDQLPYEVENIAIVAMESFLDRNSTENVRRIGREAKRRGIAFGAITNGLGLRRYLDPKLGDILDYLDVSLDGGPETYSDYRKAPFDKVVRGVEYAATQGVKRFNILNTLSDRNVGAIGDMLEGIARMESVAPVGIAMFSPYVTARSGRNLCEMMPTIEVSRALSQNQAFMARDPERCFLALDCYHFLSRGENEETVVETLRTELGDELCMRVRLFGDPVTDDRIARVTWEGLFVHPLEALHGQHLRHRPIGDEPLPDLWGEIVRDNEKIINCFGRIS